MAKGDPTPYEQIPAENLGNSVEQTEGAAESNAEETIPDQTAQTNEQEEQTTETSTDELAVQLDETEIPETDEQETQQVQQEDQTQQEEVVTEQQEEVKVKPIIPKLDFQQQKYSDEDFKKEAFDENGEKTSNYESALVKLATSKATEQGEKNHQQRQFQQGIIDIANKDTKVFNQHGNDFMQWLVNGASNLAVSDYWDLYKRSQGISKGDGNNNKVDKTLQRINKNLQRKGSIANINNTDNRYTNPKKTAAEEEVESDLGPMVE